MTRYTVAAITFFFVAASCIVAQNAPDAADSTEAALSVRTLTADQAVELALKNNIDVQVQAIETEQARREYAHSWNNVLPSINATGSGSESRLYQDADTDTLTLQAGVTASLSLDTGLASKIKQLKSAYQAGKASYEDTVRETESSVRKSFYNLLYLKEQLESARTTRDSYQRQYDQTKAKADRGVASQLDLLTAQVNLETAKPDVDSAENTYLNGLVSFLNTIGMELEAGSRVELSGTLDYAESVQELDTTKIVDECVEKSPEVRALEDSLRTARYSRSSTAASLYFPSLTLGANAYPFSWQKEQVSGTDSKTPNWTVSLGLTLPLDSWLPGSSSRDTLAQLDDTIATYELQLADKKKTVRTETVEKLKDIELSRKTLQARKMNVELAQKSYEMTEDAYNRGTKDLLTLQSSLDTLRSAQLQLREEQYTLISNVLDLETSLGLPSGSLFNTTADAE